MSRTISTSIAGPVVLAAGDNPVTITSTGTVTSVSPADGIDGGSGTSWTIGNAGVISAVGGTGISLASSSSVENTGQISGVEGLALKAGGSVTNDVGGTITATHTIGSGLALGAAVYIGGATGTVTNHATINGAAYGVGLAHGGAVTNTASITGGEDGAIIEGASGVVTNTGTITSTADDGVALFAGGSVTNNSGATITGDGTLGAGIFITGGAGTVVNSGSVFAPNHHGVLLAAGGSVTNTSTGTISAIGEGVFIQNQAGYVQNSGFITGTGTDGTGVYMETGGSATNLASGNIVGHKFGVFLEGAFTTVSNFGSITGSTYDGVVLGLGGTVTNAAGASITGLSGGVYVKYRAAGTVTNSGSISATGTAGAGIDLADGGGITNTSTGSVSGTNFGVFITGAAGTVTNSGHVTSSKYGGVELVKGGSVTNTAGATITGGSVGIYVGTSFSGTVINNGNVTATSTSGAGVDLSGGGSVTNASGAVITGGGFGVFTTGVPATVGNSGSISGSHGVGLEAGGSVTNASGATISGQVAGVFSQGAAATITNSGNITASAGSGADIEGGGSLTNLAGATISGSTFGVFVTGASGTVTNAGTISGATYAIDFTGSATNRVIVDPGAVFIGRVKGGTGTNTLELAAGAGPGTIAGIGVGSTFTNFQDLTVDTGASWVLNGANIAPTFLDNGTVSVTGSLDISTAIDPTSTGFFQIGNGATVEVAAATGSTSHVNFENGTGELTIDNFASFGTNVGTASYKGPQLQNFSTGGKIDLKNFSLAGAAFAYNALTGVLQISNSANQHASLAFQSSSLASTDFVAASDGAGGIIITDPPAGPGGVTINASGGVTDQPVQILSGLGQSGTAITLFDGSAAIGSATVQSNGSWSTSVTLANGGNTVIAEDVAGVGKVGFSNVVNFTVASPSVLALFGSMNHDVTSPGGDIYALYEAILGRAPDVLGYESFTAALEGGASLNSIAQDLLSSGEYTSKYGAFNQSSDSSFVTQLYENALHRAPDPSGLAAWDNALQPSENRAAVAVDIALSPEAQGDLAPVFQNGVYLPSQGASEIARLYYAILDRPPDATGLALWQNDLAQGDSLSNIATDFLNSGEYTTNFGATSNAQFVNALYEGALGRAADPAGEQSWLNALNQGVSRGTVAIDIAESPEAVNHLAPNIEFGLKIA